MKYCNRCKKDKPTSEFGKNKRTPDGLMRQCKQCNTDRMKKWYADNSDLAKQRKNARRYQRHGITEERYLKDSASGCMICGSSYRLSIDHDHNCCAGSYSCGKCYRGVLCHHCNSGLGHFKDDVDKLAEAMLYLQNNKHE